MKKKILIILPGVSVESWEENFTAPEAVAIQKTQELIEVFEDVDQFENGGMGIIKRKVEWKGVHQDLYETFPKVKVMSQRSFLYLNGFMYFLDAIAATASAMKKASESNQIRENVAAPIRGLMILLYVRIYEKVMSNTMYSSM